MQVEDSSTAAAGPVIIFDDFLDDDSSDASEVLRLKKNNDPWNDAFNTVDGTLLHVDEVTCRTGV